MMSVKITFPETSLRSSSISLRSRNVSTPPITSPFSSLRIAVEMLIGNFCSLFIYNVDSPVYAWPVCFQRFFKKAVPLTDIGMKHLPALSTDGIGAPGTGNLFCSSVKRPDIPILIYSENTICDGIKDRIVAVVF
jgi:hypothetical protein